MKTFVAISAVVAALSLDSASAMRTYLKKFPNGDLAFQQQLGHVGETYDLNDFGKLYSTAAGDWAKMCTETFPGTAIKVGAAFGDPCCTWKSGKADYTVTPFTVPTKGEECAANKPAAPAATPAAPAAPATTPAAAAATPAPAGKPAAPAAATPAPAGKPSAGKPSETPAVTPAPAGKPDAGKPDAGKPDAGKPSGGKPDAGKPAGKPSKCGVKADSKKESKSLEDSNDDDDEPINYED